MKKLILFAIPFIAAALVFAVAVSSEPARLPFSDVPNDAWFYGAIAEAYESGLVKGKSGTVFAPADNVTRAEVAAMLSRLDGTDVSKYGSYAAAFTDAAKGSWYREYVGWAAFSGILKGYPDGTVRPDARVTRAELSAMIKRYVDGTESDLPAEPQTGSFSDADTFDDWFSDAAEEMRVAGLIKGYENGAMLPSAPATRAEVAAVFVRLSHSLDVAGKTVLLASEYKNTRAILVFDPDFEITGHKRYEAYVEDFIGVIKDGTGYDIRTYGDVLPRRKKEIVLACNRQESLELCDGIGD
ncbi:MAG: S-layer homology domain-containing protein, partial [Clostridia bacterium]|nr:S-layer homology domain-containing protein [Clostridia bacterium]